MISIRNTSVVFVAFLSAFISPTRATLRALQVSKLRTNQWHFWWSAGRTFDAVAAEDRADGNSAFLAAIPDARVIPERPSPAVPLTLSTQLFDDSVMNSRTVLVRASVPSVDYRISLHCCNHLHQECQHFRDAVSILLEFRSEGFRDWNTLHIRTCDAHKSCGRGAPPMQTQISSSVLKSAFGAALCSADAWKLVPLTAGERSDFDVAALLAVTVIFSALTSDPRRHSAQPLFSSTELLGQ